MTADADAIVRIQTPACFACGDSDSLEVVEHEYIAWQNGQNIQDAMPNQSDEFREQLITGLHPECWNMMIEYDED